MITVQDVEKAIFLFAPKEMAYEWDHVGLLCGYEKNEVHRILVALDPFEGVCREAAELRADLIVTHHPLIFQPLQAITDRDSVGRSILFLAQHGISAINAHTNLDCAPGGVNDRLAEVLGLSDVEVIAPMGTDGEGRPWGLLRCGKCPETEFGVFAAMVKDRLHAPGLRVINSGRTVKKVAVGGGSCAGEMLDALDAGCDTFVTADVKYNQFWDAYDLGLNLIDAGHFETEDPVCDVLVDYLRERFPELEVIRSKTHSDPVQFL